MSLLTPEIPRRPLCLLRSAFNSVGPISSRAMMWRSTAGSMSPQRVPMTSPSRGVKPIEVSTDRPPRTAATEQPLPRWQVITRRPGSSWDRPRISATRRETKRWDVPWKP